MTRIESTAATLPMIEEQPACCAGTQKQEPHHERHEPRSAHEHHAAAQDKPSLNRTALMATLHCLSGCTIGEVLGMVIGVVSQGAPPVQPVP